MTVFVTSCILLYFGIVLFMCYLLLKNTIQMVKYERRKSKLTLVMDEDGRISTLQDTES